MISGLPRTGGFVALVLGGKPTTSCCEGASVLGNVMHAICVISYLRRTLVPWSLIQVRVLPEGVQP